MALLVAIYRVGSRSWQIQLCRTAVSLTWPGRHRFCEVPITADDSTGWAGACIWASSSLAARHWFDLSFKTLSALSSARDQSRGFLRRPRSVVFVCVWHLETRMVCSNSCIVWKLHTKTIDFLACCRRQILLYNVSIQNAKKCILAPGSISTVKRRRFSSIYCLELFNVLLQTQNKDGSFWFGTRRK